MTANVEKIAEQVKALPAEERDEFLSWLAEYELGQSDDWDKEIARDLQPGGPLDELIRRAKKDHAEGLIKPLDELLVDN